MNNHLQTTYQDNMTQPGAVYTDYGYDAHDNLTSVKDPNNHTTAYVYDDFGRKNKTTSPDTGITRYEYDEAGNLVKKLDAKNIEVIYTYNALNRLTLISNSLGRYHVFRRHRGYEGE